MMRLAILTVTGILVAILGYTYIPLGVWASISEELAIFFGLFAGGLLQLMNSTASFLAGDPDGLTPDDVDQIGRRLDKMQDRWIGLFTIAVLSVVVVVIAKLLHENALIVLLPMNISIDFGAVISAILTVLFVFLLSFTCTLFSALRDLQQARTEIVRRVVRTAIDNEVVARVAVATRDREPSPAGHGRVEPHA